MEDGEDDEDEEDVEDGQDWDKDEKQKDTQNSRRILTMKALYTLLVEEIMYLSVWGPFECSLPELWFHSQWLESNTF